MSAHKTKVLGHLLILAASISTGLARTETEGCTWFTTTSVGPKTTIESRVYYVPDTLEICAPDCEDESDPAKCPPVFLEINPISASAASPTSTDDDDRRATPSPRQTGPIDDDDDDHDEDDGNDHSHGHRHSSDDDDESTSTVKQTKTSSPEPQSTPPPNDTTQTVLLTATEPTPAPPGVNGPVTTSPDAEPTGAATNNRLGLAGGVVAVAMAVAAL